MSIQRLDPPDCGCTDCLTGYSKPVHVASVSQKMLKKLYKGKMHNATGMVVKVQYILVDEE